MESADKLILPQPPSLSYKNVLNAKLAHEPWVGSEQGVGGYLVGRCIRLAFYALVYAVVTDRITPPRVLTNLAGGGLYNKAAWITGFQVGAVGGGFGAACCLFGYASSRISANQLARAEDWRSKSFRQQAVEVGTGALCDVGGLGVWQLITWTGLAVSMRLQLFPRLGSFLSGYIVAAWSIAPVGKILGSLKSWDTQRGEPNWVVKRAYDL